MEPGRFGQARLRAFLAQRLAPAFTSGTVGNHPDLTWPVQGPCPRSVIPNGIGPASSRQRLSASLPSQADRIVAIQERLRLLQQRGASKPRTLTTLSSTINSIFQKKLTEEELAAILKGLRTRGYITVDENKITYALPEIET